MTGDQMTKCRRVRLVRTVYDEASHPGKVIAMIPAGVSGEVIATFPGADHDAGEPFAYVRLDERMEALDDWNNVLHVWLHDGDVTPDDFEPI